MEDKVSEVENDLHETREEMRKLTVERRKAEAERLRVSDTGRVGLGGKAVSGTQSSDGEAELAGTTERRCSQELAVGSDWRAAEGSQVSVSKTGS